MTPFNQFKHDFEGRRVLIFGLGLLGRGVSVAKLFCEIGCTVTVTDKKNSTQLRTSLQNLSKYNIRYTLGEHKREDIDQSEVIIRNPDVVWHHPLLERARKKNIPINMDTSLFAKYFPGLLIGITGTRGKTTTTVLIYEMLKSTYKNEVILAGNATEKANCALLKETTIKTIAVAELSSWELEGFEAEQISPSISIVTNIYRDHLDHHRSFSEYVRRKQAIFSNQKKNDTIILNRNNKWTKDMSKKVNSNIIWFDEQTLPENWQLKLIGLHNRENASAAYCVGKKLKVKISSIRNVFEQFKGVPHRLESIGYVNKVEFINDTTSTTPIATIKALQSMSNPTILLVGGNTKNLPLRELTSQLGKRTKAIALLRGSGSAELYELIKSDNNITIISEDRDFDETVWTAFKHADPGDSILLSPGFTSFSEFNNIFERGKRFREVVKKLRSTHGK